MSRNVLLLAAALFTLTTPAVAQNVDHALLLQTREQGYEIDTRILTAIGIDGPNLLMRILPELARPTAGFIAQSEGLPMSVTICAQRYEMPQPVTIRDDGVFSVPFPDIATAEAAASVMAMEITCDAFPQAPEPENDIQSLLPPRT